MSSSMDLTPDISSTAVSFLDLPAELRMQILRPLVRNRSEVMIHGFRDTHGSQLSLFLTCRAINDDCCELLYGTNEFCLGRNNLGPLVRLVHKIGVHNAGRIRKLTIKYNCFHYIKSKASISRGITILCGMLPSIERLELMEVGPNPPGTNVQQSDKLWKPSHLKGIEAFTKKPGRLCGGKVYAKLDLNSWWRRSAIIYHKNSNLIIPKHEVEIDIDNEWQNRADALRQKRLAWRQRSQA